MRFLFLILFVTSCTAFANDARAEKVYVKKSVIRNICQYREIILSVAAASYISPRHMLACLISEHTFLKNSTDDVVDIAASFGLYDDPSLGFTQIKLSTARPLARQLYGRDLNSQQIVADLLEPKVAALYMAQLIENIITDYAAFGFDISQSPGLVCSAYLVGQSRSKAAAHKKNNTQPKMNDYGLFAHRTQNISRRIESGELCNQ
jgi:hypothetical protein